MTDARAKVRALLSDAHVQQLLDEDFAHCLDWSGDGVPNGLHRGVHRWLVEREIDASCSGTLLWFRHSQDRFHFNLMWRGGSAAELLTNAPTGVPEYAEY